MTEQDEAVRLLRDRATDHETPWDEDEWQRLLDAVRATPPTADPHRDYAGRTCTTGLLHSHPEQDEAVRLRRALEQMTRILGPEAPTHNGVCVGCQEEIAAALQEARKALDEECTCHVRFPNCAIHGPAAPALDVKSVAAILHDLELGCDEHEGDDSVYAHGTPHHGQARQLLARLTEQDEAVRACIPSEPHPECRYGNGPNIVTETWRCFRATPPPVLAAPALDVLTLDEWKSVYAVMETEGFGEIADKVRRARLTGQQEDADA